MNFARKLYTASVLSALLALWPELTRAADIAASTPALTATSASGSAVAGLDDEESLVRFALSHNPELTASRWDQDIADAGVGSASALSNPALRAEWLHVQSPADYGWGVGLEWSPPQPGVYGARKDSARARARAVTDDLRERAADLEAKVRDSYAQIQALDQEISLAEQSVGTRRAVHEAVKERVARGAATRIDLSLVAVSLARGEQERDLLVLARASATTQLESLVGLPPGQSLALKLGSTDADAPARAAPGVSTVADAPRRDAELAQRAVSARPQLRADNARTEAADEALSAEKAKRYPWLELQARYRKHDQSNYPDDLTLGVELTLPILSQNSGPIAAAEAMRSQQRAVAAAHRLEIERDVRVLRAESARRGEIVDHYAEEIAPVLREHAALVKQALAGMELDLTAMLSAEDMVTRGGIEYVEARLAQHKAQIALERALGAYGRAAPARRE